MAPEGTGARRYERQVRELGVSIGQRPHQGFSEATGDRGIHTEDYTIIGDIIPSPSRAPNVSPASYHTETSQPSHRLAGFQRTHAFQEVYRCALFFHEPRGEFTGTEDVRLYRLQHVGSFCDFSFPVNSYGSFWTGDSSGANAAPLAEISEVPSYTLAVLDLVPTAPSFVFDSYLVDSASPSTVPKGADYTLEIHSYVLSALDPRNASMWSNSIEILRLNSQADTTVRLDSLNTSSVHGFNMKGTKRKWEDIDGGRGPGHVSRALVLQCSTSTSESSKRSSGTGCTYPSAYVADEECSMDLDLNFELKLGAENTNFSKVHSVTTTNSVSTNPIIDTQLSLSVGASASSITSEHEAPAKHLISMEASTVNFPGPAIDDGVVSSCWKNVSSRIPYGYNTGSSKSVRFPNISQFSIFTEAPKSSVDCTSVNIQKQNKSSSAKNCQHPDCVKGARGASGYCIAHGGGQRCQKDGCLKGAEGTKYCKAHGGGRRCVYLGCMKSAEGRTDYCIAHGGGRRCSKDGCTRAARGKSGLCIRHGGGKRCQKEKCTKSAEGQSGLCIAHGGGKRCQFPECTKGAQGSTMYCKAHGGGKRCSFPDCSKGAEGSTSFCKGHGGGKRCLFEGGGVCTKSVHCGTELCVAHGGGKRCAVLECTKSARGRTDYCVRHGGGRRCQYEGCGKSAQGSTDFCKAHGGGKRCSWGEDHQVHGGETLGILGAPKALPAKPDKMKGIVVEEDSNLMTWSNLDQRKFSDPTNGMASLPEGRVHGGSLMALLGSGAIFDHSANQAEGCSTSKSNQVSFYAMNFGNL
ncbi:hypothetical protein M5K25_026110 [Dendrobium thyrsiflorum]|uniref:WRKY19-like zinc finger domain-containing protein n=1 Tax=Dendrobium thyrsiflorum TaxID=117978 RepID=A0ABD0TWE9_DENTH